MEQFGSVIGIATTLVVGVACEVPSTPAPDASAATTEHRTRELGTFHGRFDPATHAVTIERDPTTVYGYAHTADDGVVLVATDPGTYDPGGGECGAPVGGPSRVCVDITATNSSGGDLTGVRAVIDSIDQSGDTSNSPFDYGGLPDGQTSTSEHWVFTLASDDDFTFTGHITDSRFIQATGGTVTQVGLYEVHTFHASDTFTITANSGKLQYLVVGGGGGGAGGVALMGLTLSGAGGGGGAVLLTLDDPTVYGTGSLAITVGAGGARGAGFDGSPSSMFSPPTPGAASSIDFSPLGGMTVAAAGGGAGNSSGGVSGNNQAGGSPSFEAVGHLDGGGGGGAGGPGMALDGGPGAIASADWGSYLTGCGGGAGAVSSSGVTMGLGGRACGVPPGVLGAGTGGSELAGFSPNGQNGPPGDGGGGGAVEPGVADGGNGGDGFVAIAFQDAEE